MNNYSPTQEKVFPKIVVTTLAGVVFSTIVAVALAGGGAGSRTTSQPAVTVLPEITVSATRLPS